MKIIMALYFVLGVTAIATGDYKAQILWLIFFFGYLFMKRNG